jgi:hypothetical protein
MPTPMCRSSRSKSREVATVRATDAGANPATLSWGMMASIFSAIGGTAQT